MSSSTRLVLDEGFTKAQSLFQQVQHGGVRLLKASQLSKLFAKGLHTRMRRQDLEQHYPEAFADDELAERCLWETEAAAKYPGVAYPGCVAISYCWHTEAHPDPTGTLGRHLAVALHWYAAQRAKWTRERLWKYVAAAGHTWSNEYDFDFEFVVFMDFWSLHQLPRTQGEEAIFRRAQLSMHEWFGHRGMMVFVMSAPPEDWEQSEVYRSRGGYDERGWPVFERQVATLYKARGMCLDLEGFEEMAAKAQTLCKETQSMERYGWRRGQLTGLFAGLTTDSMRQLAMDDFGGLVTHSSCLRWMVEGRQIPPLQAGDMDAELRRRRFGDGEDRARCMDMYRAALDATVRLQPALEYAEMTHWNAEDWRVLGAMLQGCERLEQLNLEGSGMGDAGLAGLVSCLEGGALPRLERLNARGNGVGEAGLKALGDALARGAMPRLRRVVVDVEAMEGGWEERLSSAVLARVRSHGPSAVDIERGLCAQGLRGRCAVS